MLRIVRPRLIIGEAYVKFATLGFPIHALKFTIEGVLIAKSRMTGFGTKRTCVGSVERSAIGAERR
jgi:hypothetical protein